LCCDQATALCAAIKKTMLQQTSPDIDWETIADMVSKNISER
jgi:hypothetical protein